MFNPDNMMNNVKELERRMQDPNIETGDDPVKYAKEQFIPELAGKKNKQGQQGKQQDPNRAALERYVSYL